MQRRVVAAGWYKIVDVFTSAPSVATIRAPKIHLEETELRTVHDSFGRLWYGLQYPDPTKGGLVWVRLQKLEITDKPCQCPLYRFPHRRSHRCKRGDNDGPE